MEKMDSCLYFLKYSINCLCFETIKHRIPILKFDFKKIKFPIETNFMIIEFEVSFCHARGASVR